MGDHFYTVDLAERDKALTVGGYHLERIACYVVSPNIPPPISPTLLPLFRLFNSDTGDHFYTQDAAERDHAVAHAGYREEGTACYVFTPTLPPPGFSGSDSVSSTLQWGTFKIISTRLIRTRPPYADGYHSEGSVGLVLTSPRPGEAVFLFIAFSSLAVTSGTTLAMQFRRSSTLLLGP